MELGFFVVVAWFWFFWVGVVQRFFLVWVFLVVVVGFFGTFLFVCFLSRGIE